MKDYFIVCSLGTTTATVRSILLPCRPLWAAIYIPSFRDVARLFWWHSRHRLGPVVDGGSSVNRNLHGQNVHVCRRFPQILTNERQTDAIVLAYRTRTGFYNSTVRSLFFKRKPILQYGPTNHRSRNLVSCFEILLHLRLRERVTSRDNHATERVLG